MPRWGPAALVFVLLLLGTSATAASGHVRGATGRGVFHGRGVIGGPGTTSKNRTNWAGYVVTGATFSDVIGSWVQPSVSCPTNQQQYSSFWVGFDGYPSTSQVEQTGTYSYCSKGNKKHPGGPHYSAWWEMNPQPAQAIPFPVFPGDAMTAEVSASGGSFTPTLHDATQGWTFSPGAQFPSPTPPAATAEWIVEAPTSCSPSCSGSKLANFGSVTFTGLTVTASNSFTDVQITMKKGKNIRAAPTQLSGSSFSVSWLHN